MSTPSARRSSRFQPPPSEREQRHNDRQALKDRQALGATLASNRRTDLTSPQGSESPATGGKAKPEGELQPKVGGPHEASPESNAENIQAVATGPTQPEDDSEQGQVILEEEDEDKENKRKHRSDTADEGDGVKNQDDNHDSDNEGDKKMPAETDVQRNNKDQTEDDWKEEKDDDSLHTGATAKPPPMASARKQGDENSDEKEDSRDDTSHPAKHLQQQVPKMAARSSARLNPGRGPVTLVELPTCPKRIWRKTRLEMGLDIVTKWQENHQECETEVQKEKLFEVMEARYWECFSNMALQRAYLKFVAHEAEKARHEAKERGEPLSAGEINTLKAKLRIRGKKLKKRIIELHNVLAQKVGFKGDPHNKDPTTAAIGSAITVGATGNKKKRTRKRHKKRKADAMDAADAAAGNPTKVPRVFIPLCCS